MQDNTPLIGNIRINYLAICYVLLNIGLIPYNSAIVNILINAMITENKVVIIYFCTRQKSTIKNNKYI